MKATSGGTVCGRSTSLTKVSGATSRTNSFAFGKSWGNDVLKSPGLSRVVEIQTTTSPERKAPKSEPVGCAAQRLPANSITSQHKPNSLEIDIDVPATSGRPRHLVERCHHLGRDIIPQRA